MDGHKCIRRVKRRSIGGGSFVDHSRMGLMMMLHHTQLRWLDKSSKCVELNPCNASAASDLVVVHSSLSVAALNH